MTKKFLAAALLIGLSFTAQAQQDFPRDITLSWINASEYMPVPPATVGAPIDPGDLESVRIECFRQNETVPTFTRTVPDTGEGLPQTVTFAGVIPGPGTYLCYGYSIVVTGAESDASNEAVRKFIGKPLPPQTFN